MTIETKILKNIKAIFTLFVATTLLTLPCLSRADAQTDAIKAELLQRLASAETEQEGRAAENTMWQFWFNQSPTPAVRALIDKGIERREAYDFEAAENYFAQVVEAAPDYAEGYNQRAFARFLRENYSESLIDLEKALELEPKHFGAMSGMHHILRAQDRYDAAMDLLREAVTIHPWLKERGALPEEMWPEAYRRLHEPGQEI